MVIGLAAQDTGEHVLEERGMDKIRLRAPVHHGDTLYAYTEVLETADAEIPDAGIIQFKHFGINQDDKLVYEGERTVLMSRRPKIGGKPLVRRLVQVPNSTNRLTLRSIAQRCVSSRGDYSARRDAPCGRSSG